MADDRSFRERISQAGMVLGDGISGIYGQRGNTYATYLESQNKRMQMQADAEKLRLESDPQVQAAKLASTMAMLGDSAAAERLMAFSQGKPGIQPTPGAEVQTPTEYKIPNYMGGMGLSSGNIRPDMVPPTLGGGIGLGIKSINPKGGITMGPQKAITDPIQQANFDIQKGLVSKKLEGQQTVASGVQTMAGGLGNYLDQYDRSYNELVKFDPEIGKGGLGGKIIRISGQLEKFKDKLPETVALERMGKPFAQEIATSLEGRATDQDRDLWIKVFPSVLSGPTEQNVRTASNLLISMQTKLKGTDQDISDIVAPFLSKKGPLKTMAEQFYEKFPTLKGKALGIPEGWEVVDE